MTILGVPAAVGEKSCGYTAFVDIDHPLEDGLEKWVPVISSKTVSGKNCAANERNITAAVRAYQQS